MSKSNTSADKNVFCSRCNQVITGKPSISVKEKHYHNECFKCKACSKTIDTTKEWVPFVEEKYYHKECFKCSKCSILLENAVGRWGEQLVCEECFLNKLNVPSDRKCLVCKKPIVLDERQHLYTRTGIPVHTACCRCRTCQKVYQPNSGFVFDKKIFFCGKCKLKVKP